MMRISKCRHVSFSARVISSTDRILNTHHRSLNSRWYSSLPSSSCHTTNETGSLQGLKVLDLTRVLSGPFCTQIFADYGAEVVKVETIGKGDDTRHWATRGERSAWKEAAQPMSFYFSSVNRNKKSITLDLKKPRGKDILRALASRADVLVENFKPGTMDRLGLGYDSLKGTNPRLIYASISGYGPSGPYEKRGGYDPIAAADAGLLHITGERNGPPVRTGIGMVDMSTGIYLHGAILAALYARQHSGLGQRVDTSLFETQISLLTNVGLSWLNLGIEAERWGCAHVSIAPYDAFKTKDKYLVCGATNDAQFAALCVLVGLESLVKDERFATNPKRVENRDLLTPMFKAAFDKKTAAEWVQLFQETDLPFAPINDMEGTFSHPQAEARDMIAEMMTDDLESGSIKVIGPAVKFSKTTTSLRTPPPVLGQHTNEILKQLGMDVQEINELREKGVI